MVQKEKDIDFFIQKKNHIRKGEIMKQNLYIISRGVFYRPQKTKLGPTGWVAEITFWYDNNYKGEKLPNILKVFETKEEAEICLRKKLYKLYNNDKYTFRDYKTGFYASKARSFLL